MSSLNISWAREESKTKEFAQFCISIGSSSSYRHLQHKHEYKTTQTGTQADISNLHQQVKSIINQARGGTVIRNTGMNYNIYTPCFICAWQTDGDVAF